MKKFFFSVFLVLAAMLAFGQAVTLNDSTQSFGGQVALMLEQTHNPEATTIGQDFNAIWPASFSTGQQQKIIAIALQMQQRKLGVNPFHRDFFGTVTAGVNTGAISGNKLDNLLVMLEKSLSVSTIQNYARELVNLRTFFEHQALHYTRFNRLYVQNATYDFEFVQEEAPPPPDEKTSKKKKGDIQQEDDSWGEEDSGLVEDDSWAEDSDTWAEDTGAAWAETTEESQGSSSAVLLSQTFDDIPMPVREGAAINFSTTDLIIATAYDSTGIWATSGTFLLDKYIFVGKGGKMDWSSAGRSPDEIYATLGDYSFNTRNPYIEAANVVLSYKEKLTAEPKGYFEFRSVKLDSAKGPRYPRFISYENNIRVQNIGNEHLIYTGGFGLEGNKMLGASSSGEPSVLEYSDENGKKFRVVSKLFTFQDSLITGYESMAAVYHGRDSITHPSMKARYNTASNKLALVKDKNGFNVRPLSASYYNMSIEADAINWDLNSDSLNIVILNARSLLPAYFKSNEYYDLEEIKEMTGVYNFNPLLVVYDYGSKHKTREFYVSNLVDDLKLNEQAVRGAMMHLMYLDFIEYDNVGGRIYLKEKALHYIRSKNNKKDYDDLMIPSLSTNRPNATLHLDTDELTVRGIDKFFISEILDVYIYPRENQISLLKNRDFKFDGQLFAGNFEFAGRNFTFRYDSFLVDLQNIDSIKFYIDGEGQYEKRQVDNKLVSLELREDQQVQLATNNSTSGTLYINRPDNKSGRKIFPQYPTFNADRGAIVYFDGKETLNGAYDKSVYFVVPPFGIDSLSSSDPATIGFDGTFVTGGILPEFKERLKIMPDNSLGFEHTVPQNGFALYNGPGKFYNQVQLDKNGIVGNGKINYLSSTLYSDKYVFYLDSVIATGNNFNMVAGDINETSYPDISTGNFKMKWLPNQDHMYIRNYEDSFALYNKTAILDGFIDITTKGVYGGGTMSTRGFLSKSNEFTLGQYDLMAKHSFFEMASDNPEKPLLTGDDIRLEFDFRRDVADISPEIEGMAALEFPYAQIKTSISKAQWNLQERKVYMTKPEDVAIENSYFYATRKELDSLAFNAEAAVYDLTTSQLKVSGIPYIIVGDAMITPENNQVLILENAQIGELYNTTIVIDTLNEYHRLIDGTIQIHSRKSFSGDATYEFVNALKDTFNIKLGKFELWKNPAIKNETLQTVSSGIISEDNKLRISEGMYYKGDVTMYARNKALELDGYVQFDLKSKSDVNTWIKYRSMDEETQDVMFDFNSAVTENGKRLNAGIHFGSINDELYVTFADEKKIDSDEDFFRPAGILHFDAEKSMFMIEDTAKTNGSKFSGNVFGYNDNTGDIEFEGPLNFVESSDNAALAASGFGSGNIHNGKYTINSLLKFDYKMPEQALATMAADLFEVIENFGAAPAENDPDAFLYKVSEIIGDRATEEYSRRNTDGYLPISTFTPKMAGSLVFSKVMLEWSPEQKSWYSTDKIGLSNILKADINAAIDGFIEIKRTAERGTIMNIFLQASSDSWYFFGFEDNRLSIFSSNEDFVNIIASKSNVNKAGFGEFVVVDTDRADVLKFIDRFRLVYLGIKDPYEIHTPVQEVKEEVDFLQIPVDNSDSSDVVEEEIASDPNEGWPQDTTAEPEQKQEAPQKKKKQPATEEPVTDTQSGKKKKTQPAEDAASQEKSKPAMTEEDLLNPTEKKDAPAKDDTEGF